MQNDHIDEVRPFARIMANEVSSDEAEMMAKKGLFNSVLSGHAITDWPDGAFGG
jgi:hypothetical protein